MVRGLTSKILSIVCNKKSNWTLYIVKVIKQIEQAVIVEDTTVDVKL